MNYSNLTAEQQMVAEAKKFVNKKHRELTQAEYDALSVEEKNNGTVYFVTDSENPSVDTYTKSEIDVLFDNKVDKAQGKGLSTNDYTNAEKQKLANIESNAQVNIQSDWNEDDTEDDGYIKNKPNLSTSLTATGNPITIESAESNLVECTAEVEAVQDLHGYDHPWVGGAGKNKLPITVDGIKELNTAGTWSGNVYTINNVTFEIIVDSDGNVIGIKTNGTASANANLILIRLTGSQANSLFGNNNYYLSGCASGGSNNSYYLRIFTDPWTIITTNTTDNSTSFSTDSTLSTYNLVICMIGVDSGINMSGKIFYPMIRLATETDSTFAPYTNICPISGRSEVAIERVGKNLCKLIDGITYRKAISNGVVVDSASGTWISELMPISDFDTLYIKIFEMSSYTNGSVVFHESMDGVNYTQIGSISNTSQISDGYSNSYAISSSAKYLRISGYMAGNTSSTKYIESMKLMLALSPITTYEPYKGKTYTIQLGDTIYGGELDVLTGELRVDKVLIDMSTMTWTADTADRWYVNSSNLPELKPKRVPNLDTVPNLLCDKYATYSSNYLKDNITLLGVSQNNDTYGCFQARTGDTVNPPTGILCYELATPYTIQLTPEQIRLLKGTNNISCNTGDLSIKYYPDNVLGQLKGDIEDEYDDKLSNIEETLDDKVDNSALAAEILAVQGLINTKVDQTTYVLNATDLNTLTTSGFYYLADAAHTNTPGNTPHDTNMLVISGYRYATQIYVHRLQQRLYFRTGTGIGTSGETWGEWHMLTNQS